MKTLSFALLLFGLSAQASIVTNVVHMEKSPEGDKIEVFVTHEGRVFEIDPQNTKTLADLKEAIESGDQVELNLNEGPALTSGNIASVALVRMGSMRVSEVLEEDTKLHPLSGYTPSNVSSLDEAKKVFSTLNNKTKIFSQCFNRAHIWAKQMYDDFGIHSEKILIYYTKRYRKEVNRKWWFHIAPVVSVNGERYVMDRSFTDEPVTATKWEGMFNKLMDRTGYRCQKIENISAYFDDSNMSEEYCNIQHTSMYYWEPNDMMALEKTGEQKLGWVNWELRAAAKEAFRSWRKVYRTVKVSE